VLDAELAELPAGQPRALEQRPGLVHDHVAERAAGVQGADHPERGAPAQAGQGAGVAVGVDAEPAGAAGAGEIGGAAPADPEAHLGGGGNDRERRRLDGGAAPRGDGRDRGDLAAQVDRGRPGVGDPLDLRAQPCVVPALVLPLADRHRHAEGARRA
jgi:hypothetical protein